MKLINIKGGGQLGSYYTGYRIAYPTSLNNRIDFKEDDQFFAGVLFLVGKSIIPIEKLV